MKIMVTVEQNDGPDAKFSKGINEGDILIYDNDKDEKSTFTRQKIEDQYSSLIQFVSENEVGAIITPAIAPMSLKALRSKGIEIFQSTDELIGNSFNDFAEGKLEAFTIDMANNSVCTGSCSSCQGACH